MADSCNCGMCVDDPALTCSYTGEDVSVDAVYLPRAFKGDLVLCPGGANGDIGGLLHQLTPPQHFSHMGIMVAKHDLIRHCTADSRWLTAPEYYIGSLLGVAAPVDGLNPEHVQHGWPGSITQSARQILFADQYGDAGVPPGYDGPYRGSDLPDPASQQATTYRIAAMSFTGVFDGDRYFPPLLVQPCPTRVTPEVIAALDRIAERALDLYAHYRFYCYTNATIGAFPDYSTLPSEVPDSRPDWDPDTMEWRDWSDPTQIKWRSDPTVPAMFASFIWQAVQDVSNAGPEIKLDWADDHLVGLGEDNGACRRTVAPDWTGDVIDQFTEDGLYFYDERSRQATAKWLYSQVSLEVYSSLKDTLKDGGPLQAAVSAALDDIGRGTFLTAAAAGATQVAELLTPLLPGVGVLDVDFIEQLIELLYDMPSDIANQLCNSFAFDCHRGFPGDGRCVDARGNEIRDVDSSNWSDAPGLGRAVSPDNIHMFWDAPGPSNPPTLLRGLYGMNFAVRPVAAVVKKPRCELVLSTGVATITGQVRHQGQAVVGAHVEVGCQYDVTRPCTQPRGPGCSLSVKSGGHYKLIARYTDPDTRVDLYGEKSTGKPTDAPIAPGATLTCDIDVIAPPVCLRNIFVTGTIHVEDVSLFDRDSSETTFLPRSCRSA